MIIVQTYVSAAVAWKQFLKFKMRGDREEDVYDTKTIHQEEGERNRREWKD